MKAGYSSGWEIEVTGKGKVTLVVGLVLKHLRTLLGTTW